MNITPNDTQPEIITDDSDDLSQKKNSTPLAHKQQINLIKKGDIVEINLPSSNDVEINQWQRIIDDFKLRLRKIDTSWQLGTKAHIKSNDRLLDTRQLQELKTILEQTGLNLNLIITRRRQTAVAAASAGYSVQQESFLPDATEEDSQNQSQSLAEPLYLRTTIRSGVEICHPSTVIVIGDVNPGANIIAGGDVLVWGCLKGIAHAGAMTNRQGIIMALRMTPTQLRIADLVARVPDNLLPNYPPEVAYISDEGIKINSAFNFYRNYQFIVSNNYWLSSEIRS